MRIRDIPKVNNKSTKDEYAHAHHYALKCAKEIQAKLDERDSKIDELESARRGHRATIEHLEETLEFVRKEATEKYEARIKQQEEKHTAELETARRDRIVLEDAVCAQAETIAITIMRARRERDEGDGS